MVSTALMAPISVSIASTLAMATAPLAFATEEFSRTEIKRYIDSRNVIAATSNITQYRRQSIHVSELAVVTLVRSIFGAVSIERDTYTDFEEGWTKSLLRIDTSGLDVDVLLKLESLFYERADNDDTVLSELGTVIVKFV
jgi:hypothetical protein